MSTQDETGPASAEGGLFGDQELPPSQRRPAEAARPAGQARVVMPNRTQVELRPMDLESLLAEGHRARLVWAWVERQDMSAMYEAIKVRQGGVGRSAIAPEILLALWLYATLQGVGSARQLSRSLLYRDGRSLSARTMLVTPSNSVRTVKPATAVANHMKVRRRENAGRSKQIASHQASQSDIVCLRVLVDSAV